MKLYLVAGEASGDEHGAALMRALRQFSPEIEFHGRGGPKMQSVAGKSLINWSDSAAVVGLWEVLKRYRYFRGQFQCALAEISQVRPDAVVLIDYPGFNLRLARALRFGQRSSRFGGRIIYYISPQVWAWNRGRIREMARYLDLMLCIFPFEAELYNQSGLRTVFVGHPMIQNLASLRTDIARQQNLIGIFPGSRLREIRTIFPIMMEAGERIVSKRREVRFEVAAASESLLVELEGMLSTQSIRDQTTIVRQDAAGTMQRAFAGLVASGTATLEAAYFRLPFVLVYKVSWLTYIAARCVVKTDFLGMPNILANEEIVREFIQHQARPEAIARAVLDLMNDQAARDRMKNEFDAIISKLGEGGASERAAKVLLDELASG